MDDCVQTKLIDVNVKHKHFNEGIKSICNKTGGGGDRDKLVPLRDF